MTEPTVSWGLASDGPDRPMRSDSKRNRDTVVDALLSLHREGNLRPSSNEIAERAGISPRSLFRYFADIDDLSRAAISRQLDRVRPMLEIDVAADADVAERVAALATSRARVFETMGPSGLVARLRAPFKPVIAAELAHARLFFRQQVEQVLAPELARMDVATRTATVAAIDVLCSFESWQLLRNDQGMDEAAAGAALRIAVVRLLGGASA
jgi:TetR/AcrR family transcriptional regulator, regulator of autoinduction and epiphytic fitness